MWQNYSQVIRGLEGTIVTENGFVLFTADRAVLSVEAEEPQFVHHSFYYDYTTPQWTVSLNVQKDDLGNYFKLRELK